MLGDGGFQLLPWLMTPFTKKQENDRRKDAVTRTRHKLFSKDQKSTRACIEKAFGVLKGRYWNCLRDGLQCRLNHTSDTVLACVLLHNICIAKGDVWATYDANFDADDDRGLRAPMWLKVNHHAPQPEHADRNAGGFQGRIVRERLSLMRRANRRPEEQARERMSRP